MTGKKLSPSEEKRNAEAAEQKARKTFMLLQKKASEGSQFKTWQQKTLKAIFSDSSGASERQRAHQSAREQNLD